MPEGSIEIPIVFLGHRTIAFLYSDASVSPKLNAVLPGWWWGGFRTPTRTCELNSLNGEWALNTPLHKEELHSDGLGGHTPGPRKWKFTLEIIDGAYKYRLEIFVMWEDIPIIMWVFLFCYSTFNDYLHTDKTCDELNELCIFHRYIKKISQNWVSHTFDRGKKV